MSGKTILTKFTDISIRDNLITKRLATALSIKIEKCDKVKVENINWIVIDMTDFVKLEPNAKAKHSPTFVCPEIMGAELPNLYETYYHFPRGN